MRSLFDAVHTHDIALLRNLVGSVACIDQRDDLGRTPLMEAVIDQREVFCGELIKHGADVNATDHNGFSPLHFAAQAQAQAVVALLLESGAEVDAVDREGNTPLWRAVFTSRGEGGVIELLLRHGANPDKENRHGVSPRALADRIANYSIGTLLPRRAET